MLDSKETTALLGKTKTLIMVETALILLQERSGSFDLTECYINLDQEIGPQEEKLRNSFWYKFRFFFNDSIDKHPLEQRFLFKLDAFLLLSAMLGYFAKNLNHSNISTAYVNGMDSYFDMDHNQYNYLLSLWTFGYVLGQLPANFILHRVNIRYFLGFLELSWLVIMVLQFYCESLQTLYVLRFLLAILQAPLFISLEYLLGSWWLSRELSKRSTFLAVSLSLASIVSGPLQQALLVRFKHSPVPAFKWLFLVDAAITLPIGLFTLVANPNVPATTNNWYWTPEDKLVALERRRRIGAPVLQHERITTDKVRQYVRGWHFWVFPLVFYAFNNLSHANSQPAFVSWMKDDLRMPSEAYNTIPAYLHGAGIVLAIAVGYWGDFLGGNRNHVFIYGYFGCMAAGCALLVRWDLPNWVHWGTYFLIGIPASWVQPQVFSWVNRLLVRDNTKRLFIVTVTNTLAYVVGSVVPIYVWNTADRPRYRTGFVYTLFLSLFGLGMTAVAVHFSRRDDRLNRGRVTDGAVPLRSRYRSSV